MNRREFLAFTSAIVILPNLDANAQSSEPHEIFDSYFRQIFDGFMKNASPDLAVCDFPEGTKIKSCLTPSGKSYVSIARMLPAMTEWTLSGRGDLREQLLKIYRNAFDPKHADFWGLAPAERATQKTVESSMVAYCLFRLGDDFVGKISSQERQNIQSWLASCTQVPERKTNHAWFTALNQATRLELSRKWPEFKGDEKWMLDDLAALDALFIPNNDGWYSDWTEFPIYDYYNFWTFANFPLYWANIIGQRYPEWADKFRGRVKLFLEKTPYFFGENGAHPLYGRSLIYRFALLSPMLLGYEQKLWPHSPGMLRRIVRKSLEHHWQIGAFDEKLGKLRETYSAQGTPDVKENYVDNGHPYWCMQIFSSFAISKDDSFWTAKEEPLPVEQKDFAIKFEGPKMLLLGNKSSGQVKWVQSITSPRRDTYRDRYVKLVASSHFPYCVLPNKNRAPWDQALIFRDKSGACAGREKVLHGKLLDDGIENVWSAKLGSLNFHVTTHIRFFDEFEYRRHEIAFPDDASDIEIVEGSYALGLEDNETATINSAPGVIDISANTGRLVTWPLNGYVTCTTAETFEESQRTRTNLIHASIIVPTLRGPLSKQFASLHYASPRPLAREQILRRRDEILPLL